MAPAKPVARGKSGRPINVLISALVVIALVPSAILFVQLWQDMMRPHSVTLPVTAPPTAEPPRSAGLDYPKDGSRFAVEDGDDTPSYAGFEAGNGAPGSAGGWSFAAEETGALPSSMPAPSGATYIAADSFAQHGTLPGMAPAPAETAMVDATDRNPFEQTEPTVQSDVAVPLPERKPGSSVGTAPVVRTVKVVTIVPPQPTRPHDGAYALGSPADEAQAPAEWLETKTAVDMHAKAEQSSETVKVAEGGIKMRVTARDKNWVKVTDPKTSTSGWIYTRFLQPTEPPAP